MVKGIASKIKMSGSDSEMELASVKSGFSYKSRSSTNSRSSSALAFMSDCFRLRGAMAQIQKTEPLLRSYCMMLKHENPEDKEMNDLLRRSIMDTIDKEYLLKSELRTLTPCTEPASPDHSTSLTPMKGENETRTTPTNLQDNS
ncbi:hypothetical protein TNIN_357041 [Trichonephila inaurata madagascariensis]|uniref:Uncharacterized protein n=1 Tax=Trichonephila inaurata madagascariensis TaxID=2747483 RepID=A0A8X6XSU7_9ARAC|nr:hypothetical protein TNIN_357041 [Trichonephila inaurata madagascariensis]